MKIVNKSIEIVKNKEATPVRQFKIEKMVPHIPHVVCILKNAQTIQAITWSSEKSIHNLASENNIKTYSPLNYFLCGHVNKFTAQVNYG